MRCALERLHTHTQHWYLALSAAVMHAEHFADDLEVSLEADMCEAFNVELEDDSAREARLRIVGCQHVVKITINAKRVCQAYNVEQRTPAFKRGIPGCCKATSGVEQLAVYPRCST